MEVSVSTFWNNGSANRVPGFSRRELGRMASFLVFGGLMPLQRASAAQASSAVAPAFIDSAPNLYASISLFAFATVCVRY
jgi:hypothetical protein